MYSVELQREVKPDMDMVERIIKKLNEKFDPNDMYHHSSAATEMFEFQYHTDSHKREAWQIVFMGHYTVVSGGSFGLDYDDCFNEDYLFLNAKNERKIFMLAVNGAITVISNMMKFMAFSDVSEKNKQEWIDTLKKGIVYREENPVNYGE